MTFLLVHACFGAVVLDALITHESRENKKPLVDPLESWPGPRRWTMGEAGMICAAIVVAWPVFVWWLIWRA